MPGEAIILVDDAAGQASRFVTALAALPAALPPWVVIGGFAVCVRLARVHRATGDVDTMTLRQDELVELVVAQPGGERLGTGKARLAGVDMDVMPVPGPDDEPPKSPSARAFHLVRRHALTTAVQEHVIVVDPASVRHGPRPHQARAEVILPVAGPGALVLLKAVALPRRAGAHRTNKIVSDTQDLVRLVASRGLDALVAEARAAPTVLTSYVGGVLAKRCGQDGRYLLAMLRRAGVLGVEADDLALVAELGRVLIAQTDGPPRAGLLL